MHESEVKNTCPWCQAEHDRASPIGGEWAPAPGDLSLCVECGGWCVFGPELELEKPNAAAAKFLAADPECKRVKWAWTMTKRRRQ